MRILRVQIPLFLHRTCIEPSHKALKNDYIRASAEQYKPGCLSWDLSVSPTKQYKLRCFQFQNKQRCFSDACTVCGIHWYVGVRDRLCANGGLREIYDEPEPIRFFALLTYVFGTE